MGFVLMLTNSCKKEKDEIPVLATTVVTDITQTTAASGANITSDGGAAVTARGVCWSTATTPTIADSKASNGTGTGVFTCALTGLTPGTTYYVRGYATNSAGTAYGAAKSFTALPLLGPVVVTNAVTVVGQTTATSGGRITYDGGAAITAKGVCWSTSATPTIADSKTTDGTDTAAFVSAITGLTASTTYYVRAYATNSIGTTYGTAVSFTTTAAPVVPTVNTTAVTAIAQTTASSGGSISADGGEAVTEKGVCWSTSATPTITDPKTLDGTGTATFTSAITGLTASTTYYVRAYATNNAGTGYGAAVSFTTSTESGIGYPVLTTRDIILIGHATAISGGTVTADGGTAVTERGVCWSTSAFPTITDNKSSDAAGTGTFKSAISGLSITTTYYVRAYATNSAGTSYGEEKSFTTWGNPILDIDGNEYHEVVIGTQTWLVENLRTKHYKNGDPILNLTVAADWSIDSIGAWVYYANDSATYEDRGLYYNRYTILNPSGIAIEGYHVPSYAECFTLQTLLGGKPVAGGAMKEIGTTHWYAPNEGATNSSGFTSLPSGRRNADGTFVGIVGNGYLLTTNISAGESITMRTDYNTTAFGDTKLGYKVGIPIRLIKD